MKQPPFKVLCVSRGDYNITTRKNIASPIEVGTEYTVIGTLDSAYGTGYFIAGFGASTAFLARLFATLPSTTEEIAIECEIESIIYQR